MTKSWRRDLADLNETQQQRELTEREIIRYNDAVRKRQKEIGRVQEKQESGRRLPDW
jgi:hypothetical protein